MALHCPECGFSNAEGSNYCQRCGSFIASHPPEGAVPEGQTATYRVGETGEFIPVEIGDVVEARGAALVIRSGGGRTGESFVLEGERRSIGRRPDADIFLDDVTVSRDHAMLVHRSDEWFLDDLGSLNGTWFLGRRIGRTVIQAGDQALLGRHAVTFIAP